ncbi:MAG: CDF family Co(II)/Ni(II) efflux transporter DmeF [Porticoccaceae bacterium]
MHSQSLKKWRHDHDFAVNNPKGERRTRYVLLLTLVTMAVEIVAGSVYGSMALLADGLHMGTHVVAFVIAIFTYSYARRHANNPLFTFGTGKVDVLGGFTSAVVLAVVALVMLVESLQRLLAPQAIGYNEAIVVAIVGLGVNLLSAFLLHDHHDHDHDHGHDHDHDHDHDHGRQDHNLKAAYMHVLADAMTSLLAIIALLSGKYWGLNWLDPLMGIVGAVIITSWAFGLLRQTAPILLDASVDETYARAIQSVIEQDSDDRVSDIHVWKLAGNHYGAIVAIVTHDANTPDYYRALLKDFDELSHITIEVQTCQDPHCGSESQ